jgi:hypothetical protein
MVAEHAHLTTDCTLSCDVIVNDAKLRVNALIDTGALQSNYVSIKTGEWIKIQQEADKVERSIATAVTQHTCCSEGKNSVLRNVPCVACNNKPYKNNEDFLFDSTNSNSSYSSGKKRKHKTLSHIQGQVGTDESTIPELPPLNAHSLTVDNNTTNNTKVCSGIKGLCTQSTGEVTFDFKFKNELNDSYEILRNLQAKLIDTSFDIIVGRPDIVKHAMLGKLCEHFGKASNGEVPTHSDNTTHGCPPVLGQPSVPQDHPALNLLIRKDDLLTPEEDDDGIELKVKDYLWELEDYSIPEGSSDVKPLIEGSKKLRERLEKLIDKYNDIFSEQPRPTPATLEPMEFEVDYTAWQKPKNRLPPRIQTRAKEYEIERQINKMIANNIIKPSQAAYYSQVHLTPKPNGKWRFCLDYRPLNGCSDLKGWPIPNVKRMLQRLGSKRSKFYAVMDLTSGYHQAPLSKKSQSASAFITFMGVYEWLRVPMGLKGAPSYFQQQMATKVLANLIYHICELYLDDIIVFGNTEEEFLNNLSRVFERLRKFGITVNPSKCRFGLSEIEYVGHVINENGLTFSTEKREEVLQFPLPTTHKGMKQFLGLANYFRDNVQNHSMLVRPLQEMVEGYSKNKPLKWTPELVDIFNEVRIKVGECPALTFMREDLPVFLHTDASDYGIGAYLFQKSPTEEIELPVAFISKSLTRERLRWSVPEKEAYAIYYAFQKLEYLIRDTYFVLRTDHKNLTYINEEGSPKIRRWKLAIQEYNFDIEYIKGEDNVVADALSRLCTHTSETEEQLLAFDDSAQAIPPKKYKLIAKVHNSTAGHNGVEKTLEKLEARGVETWPYMREHIKQFIRQCPICQKLDQRKIKINAVPFTNATLEPMDTLNIDSIGPVPLDQYGNCHILVIIDCFTRFVELYPTVDTTAKSAAKCILQHIGRYGTPRRIRTDQGPQFVNETMAELTKSIGVEHEMTLAYSKEESAIVERANKEVMRHLKAILLDKNIVNDWSNSLPLVQRIMNASVHSALGVSPAQLLFGNAVTLDRGIFLPHAQKAKKGVTDGQENLSEWADSMLAKQAELLDIARKSQKQTDDYHIVQASGGEVTEFPINSYVLAKYRDRPPTKFHTPWKGPMRVIASKKNTYTLQDLVTNKEYEYHVTQLKTFQYDRNETDPVDIARKEAQEFVVDQVLQHRGDPKKRSTLEFLIKWEGYDDSNNSWEPWANVKDNIKLNNYLYTHKLKMLLTREQKNEIAQAHLAL